MIFRKSVFSIFLLVLLVSQSFAFPSVGKATTRQAKPAGDVVVVINEQFLSSILEQIAAQPNPPRYKLSKETRQNCADEVTLLPESQGTRTSVRIVDGQLTAPVAFRGSYEPPVFGCINFEGWADTAFDLQFDAEKQSFNARIRIRALNLKSVPSVMNSGVTALVQDALDERVNPVRILRADQLGATLPASGAGTSGLNLRVKEVRHEVTGKELRLRIVYEIVSKG